MEYLYQKLREDNVNELLNQLAREGWRVNTFNRNPGASVVDVLLERQVRKPKTTAPRGGKQ